MRAPYPYQSYQLPNQNSLVRSTNKPYVPYQQQPAPQQMIRSSVNNQFYPSPQMRPPSYPQTYPSRTFQPPQNVPMSRPQFQIPNQPIIMQSPARQNFAPERQFQVTPNRTVPYQQYQNYHQPAYPTPPAQQYQQRIPPQISQIPPKPQQTYQQPQVNQQQNQPKEPYNYIANDEDLERKFEEAIKRTKQLVNKYQNPNQPQQQPQPQPQQQQPPQQYVQQPQQQQSNSPPQELQELALQYEDGYIYRGQGFEPSTREGYGQLCDQSENEVYSGYWKDNQYHGNGKLINFQAETIKGQFDYRELNNIENAWFGYEGEFSEGKMHGKGALQLTNGERFEGIFNDGMIEGEGVFHTLENQEVRGLWRDGVLEQIYE